MNRVINKKITKAECLKRAEFWLNKAESLINENKQYNNRSAMNDLDSFSVDIIYFKKQGGKYISETIEEIDHGVGEITREIKEKAKRRASELEAYIEVARWNDNGSIKSDFYFPSGDRIAGFHNGNPYIADDFNRPL